VSLISKSNSEDYIGNQIGAYLYVAGEEFIDKWKNLRSGAVMYFCSLCDRRVDNKLIVTHAKGQEHRLQYKV